MSYEVILFLVFCISGLLATIISVGLMFYIGKTRIKQIDKVVYGYEFPHDSIFALMIRVPNYASGFMWKWSAKRSGLEGKIEQFDNKFKKPFILSFVLVFFGVACFVAAILMEKLVLE